jgi:hypothetical protein
MSAFQLVAPYEPAGDQPQAIVELVEGTRCCSASPARARPSPWRKVIQDGAAPRAGPGAQQDAGRAALWRDEELLPGQRGRVFRLVLRLLPARSLRPAHRHLHREGFVHQRADRPDAPLRDARAARARRRHHRRLRLLHLRHRLGGDLHEAMTFDLHKGRQIDRSQELISAISSSCNTSATTMPLSAAPSGCAATRSNLFPAHYGRPAWRFSLLRRRDSTPSRIRSADRPQDRRWTASKSTPTATTSRRGPTMQQAIEASNSTSNPLANSKARGSCSKRSGSSSARSSTSR